jgi:hypothetical protein
MRKISDARRHPRAAHSVLLSSCRSGSVVWCVDGHGVCHAGVVLQRGPGLFVHSRGAQPVHRAARCVLALLPLAVCATTPVRRRLCGTPTQLVLVLSPVSFHPVLMHVLTICYVCCGSITQYNAQINQRLLSGRHALGGVLSSYRPPLYMPHGHFQNLFTFVWSHFPHVQYKRELLPIRPQRPERYPGTVALDWAFPPPPPSAAATSTSSSSAASAGAVSGAFTAVAPSKRTRSLPASASPYTRHTPTVIVFHGLAGGSSENYVRATISALMRAGYRCVAFNARGCGGNALLSTQMFCAAYEDWPLCPSPLTLFVLCSIFAHDLQCVYVYV